MARRFVALLVMVLLSSGAMAQGLAKPEALPSSPAAPQVPAGPPPAVPAESATAQCPDNMDAYAGSDETLACICPAGQMASGAVWGTDVYTTDSATCRAAQHAGVIGRRGGNVSIRILPGATRYPGTTRNGISSTNYGQYRASYRFEGGPAAPPAASAAAPQAETVVSQCPDNMSAFSGSDEVVRCACSAEATGSGSVWGTDTYTADSASCRAALHAGAVGRRGGEVTIRMLPGQARYPGTTRNGFASFNYGSYDGSYRFEGVPARTATAPAPAAASPEQCPDNMLAYAGSDEALTCLCPGEATLAGAVWGTDTYTADSATCRAAVHAGSIAQTGGMVTLRMLPGQGRYPGTTRNRISSNNYGAYDASYRFEGGQRAASSAPVQAPVAESLRRSGQVQLYVTFRTNSAELDISAAPVLMQVRDALVADPGLRLRLVGHTDSTGSDKVNTPLSAARAQSVQAWLVANGVAADRLVTEGRGPTQPIADNGSEAGRQLNRRVQAVRVE